MPDEREDGLPGPTRPSQASTPAFRTERPGPDGTAVVEQRSGTQRGHLPPGHPDPRFEKAPLTDAERKALYDARTFDETCQLLGQFQEARQSDGAGRAPNPPQTFNHLTLDEQVARGIRPTAQQLAHIQAGHGEAQKERANQFLEERKQQNLKLFKRSRHWGQEGQHQDKTPPPYTDKRLKATHGRQSWRAEITDVRKEAYRTTAREVADALPADPRFERAPITAAESEALGNAKTFDAARQILSKAHEDRIQDGRLTEASGPHAQSALINHALSLKEQIALDLRPTAKELTHMRAGALRGEEAQRTLEFIATRQGRDTQYWKERTQQSTRGSELEARTEQTGKRQTSLRQLKHAMQERRDKDAEHTNQGHQGSQGAGRGR